MAALGVLIIYTSMLIGIVCAYVASNRLDQPMPMKPSKQIQLLDRFASEDLGTAASNWQVIARKRRYLTYAIVIGFALIVGGFFV